MAALSLLEVLATVPGPRGRKGQRHPLSAVMEMVVLARLSGRTGLISIARFGRQHGDE